MLPTDRRRVGREQGANGDATVGGQQRAAGEADRVHDRAADEEGRRDQLVQGAAQHPLRGHAEGGGNQWSAQGGGEQTRKGEPDGVGRK